MTSLELLPVEDRDVLADEWLLRYIHWRQTQESGELTTAAFRSTEASVDRERLLPSSRTAVGDEFPNVGTTKFQAKDCIGAKVMADPLPENLAHAVIVVPDNKRALRDKLAEHLKKLVLANWDAAACVPLRQAAERRSES